MPVGWNSVGLAILLIIATFLVPLAIVRGHHVGSQLHGFDWQGIEEDEPTRPMLRLLFARLFMLTAEPIQ